jgi:hypothetical protein
VALGCTKKAHNEFLCINKIKTVYKKNCLANAQQFSDSFFTLLFLYGLLITGYMLFKCVGFELFFGILNYLKTYLVEIHFIVFVYDVNSFEYR